MTSLLCSIALFCSLGGGQIPQIPGRCTCDFCLSQQHFDGGTYRIESPGLYCITEDIVFNPAAGDPPNDPHSYFPTDEDLYPGSGSLHSGAFALGFFAAISVEASDVIIDLLSHSISMHFDFYLQQRFYSHIEIANQPFLPNVGPASFGDHFKNVENVTICHGELGLSSHHGIHSNNASNIEIYDLDIYDFEVGGIQLNGFLDANLCDLRIGPSLQSVPLSAYYSNARFVSLALYRLLEGIKNNELEMPSVSFSYLERGESMALQLIYDQLVHSMNLVFDFLTHRISESEAAADPLFDVAMDLFSNSDHLPDGSAVYGIVLNSFSVAVDGFGSAQNEGQRQGEGVVLNNVVVDGLNLSVSEVIAMYFDECDDIGSGTHSVLKGPFGDIMDITKMVHPHFTPLIEEYESTRSVLNRNIKGFQYLGNPLSDAQIALHLFGDYLAENGVNDAHAQCRYGSAQCHYGSYLSDHFLQWAVHNIGDAANPWAECADFVCNGDVMFHTNKGVIGVRIDGIENVEFQNVAIRNLENSSPLVSGACSSYSGPHDGGHPGTEMREGGMGTDIRGISVVDGDVLFSESVVIENLNSWYGDAVAVDVMEDTTMQFDDENALEIKGLTAATKVTEEIYDHLVKVDRCPFPNNFNICTIAVDDSSRIVNAPLSMDVNDCRALSFGKTTTLEGDPDDICGNGWLAANGACCHRDCGQCDIADRFCSSHPGGALKCCSNLIAAIGKLCRDGVDPPCLVADLHGDGRVSSSLISGRARRLMSVFLKGDGNGDHAAAISIMSGIIIIGFISCGISRFCCIRLNGKTFTN